MQITALGGDAARLFAVVFGAGEEVMRGLVEFAERRAVGSASFTAVGAFQSAELSFFDPEAKAHVPIPVLEQTEVLALTGNIALKDGQPVAHTHAVLGRRDGSTVGGHVQRATVGPTLEVMVTVYARPLLRRLDPDRGLPVLDREGDGGPPR